tara:strand:- start:3 stop:224 length:222 start_codon:yes stop_codon:yes gene_type:complete
MRTDLPKAANGFFVMVGGIIVCTLGVTLFFEPTAVSLKVLTTLMVPLGLQLLNVGYHLIPDLDAIPGLSRISR